jgi:hypothetical protein
MELKPKIKKFREIFIGDSLINDIDEKGKDVRKWAYQHLPDKPKPGESKINLVYWTPKGRELLDQDLLNHFSGVPMNLKGSKRASLALVGGRVSGDKIKWFCLDCDTQNTVDITHEKIIPVLEKYDVDYIWEHSGEADEKGHLWFLCELPKELLKAFITQVFKEIGLDLVTATMKLGFELYPIASKKNNLIRLPGGYHLRNKKVNPITYKGKTSNDLDFILDTFINARKLTETDLEGKIDPESIEKPKIRQYTSRRFYYHSRNLPLPFANLPPIISKVASNCQAINKLLQDCRDDDLLSEKSGAGHSAGLFIMGLAVYNDFRQKSGNTISKDGREWAENFFENYRDRDYYSHGWQKTFAKAKEEGPERVFPGCKAWEEAFGLCNGCPFKDKPGFTSPRQLWSGSSVKKTLIKELRLVTADWVRNNTFIRFKNYVHQQVDNNCFKDILLASNQGVGKSVLIDDIAIELAKKGKTILIAVPTADLAMEHRRRLMQKGEKPFIVMGHKNLFVKFKPGFDCPKEDEIAYIEDLGLGSGVVKNKFCKNCPLLNFCPYPSQYKNVYEKDHKIVIIQHAHLRCKETMYAILKKDYDVMFIDEAFINNIQVRMQPTDVEIEVLNNFRDEIPWAGSLADWLERGGYPENVFQKVVPLEIHLEAIRDKLTEYQQKYRIPEFLRYFSLNTFMNRLVGLNIFYPLPDIPVRVFTDATPPLEYLEAVLDNEEIEVFGDDEILDYRAFNPANRVFQVLDGSMSKTALKGVKDELTGEYDYQKLIEILEFIGDKARGDFKDQKILITTYLDSKTKEEEQFATITVDWLKANYPELDIGTEPPHQICVSHMMIGTNMWEDYTVQFLLAGVYRAGEHFYKEVYDFRSIKNYWNRYHDHPEIPNPFYTFKDSGISGPAIEKVQTNIKKVLNIGSLTGIFEYPGFHYWNPLSIDHNIIERYAIAKTQQAIRLRFNDSNQRTVYIFGNYFLPSFLITDPILEDDILGYLRKD